MLKPIEEFQKAVGITGFCNVKLGDAKTFLDKVRSDLPSGVEVQVFDADLIATWQHLYFGTLNALTAFKNGRNLSKSLAVETVLYVSAQRQIKKALNLVGVKEATGNLAVLAVGEKEAVVSEALLVVADHLGAVPDEGVLELSQVKVGRIREVFGVSDAALQAVSAEEDVALVALVVEQMALLATRL